MSDDTFRRALLRSSLAILATLLFVAPHAYAEEPKPAADSSQVQDFFNGIALDRQLAEQHSAPLSPVAATPQGLDQAALVKLEKQVNAAPAGDEGRSAPVTFAAPTFRKTTLLVLAWLALLGFVGGMATLSVRAMRKDAKQRRDNYHRHRRINRRDVSSTATLTG